MIEAKVVCDSIAAHSPRLTTFQLRYWKATHGEFMTHRAFSRNASSSRAIPVSKNLAEVRSDELRAAPVWWGREQKGMQSGEELDDVEVRHWVRRSPDPADFVNVEVTDLELAKRQWRDAAHEAIRIAEKMVELGVHKSIVNRILEPFLHINVVATSCEPGLLNFFGLRLDRAAQPEIRVLAEQMWAAWQASTPQTLEPGQWHLPFVDDTRDRRDNWEFGKDPLIKISVARCARVSYLSHETGRRSTIEEDLALYERLVGSQPLHASPAEHQATPDQFYPSQYIQEHVHGEGFYGSPQQHGNLTGWIQFRKTLSGEAVAPLPEAYR